MGLLISSLKDYKPDKFYDWKIKLIKLLEYYVTFKFTFKRLEELHIYYYKNKIHIFAFYFATQNLKFKIFN